MRCVRTAEHKIIGGRQRKRMKFRKIAEWEEHDTVPGGDIGFLLEAVEVLPEHLRYVRISWSVLSDAEFDALERSEVVDLTDPSVLIDDCEKREDRRCFLIRARS
ncbi:MAG: hypothetical protein HY268_05225 [Deltaproteobacteria bacterium]|nr:hypothetical protein [Deltaproteobacteria bacterium]